MWQVQVDSVKVHGGSVDVTDETTLTDLAPAATVRLNEVALNAQRVVWPMAQPVAFNGSAAFVGTEGLTLALPQAGTAVKPGSEKATGAKAAGKSGGQADSAAGTKSGAQASPASASDSGSSSAAATANLNTSRASASKGAAAGAGP